MTNTSTGRTDLFKNECKVINLKYEYEGYTGMEQWAIVSELTEKELFEKYPDVVEVDDLRKMLGGISRRLAYRLLAEQEIRCVKVGRAYKIPKVCVIEYLMGEDMCAASIYHEPN